jgi:hypothetical protein
MLERVFECLGWRPQRVPLRRSAEAVFTRLMGKAPQQLAAYGAD